MTVDDLIADIATVFHWRPQDVEEMGITELINWREKAIKRSQYNEQ